MTLQSIEIPDSIKKLQVSDRAASLIDEANDRIEAFMLTEESVTENFVTCDFHLVEQALQWIQEHHLLSGDRFCELGSGFGVAAMLAAARGMEAVGIEIESNLASQANDLADELGVDATFYRGSFVPRGTEAAIELEVDIEHVETEEGDVYEEIGLAMDDFDLFFAFPWPGESVFFESVFDAFAADGALLLTYMGRDGMKMVRKV